MAGGCHNAKIISTVRFALQPSPTMAVHRSRRMPFTSVIRRFLGAFGRKGRRSTGEAENRTPFEGVGGGRPDFWAYAHRPEEVEYQGPVSLVNPFSGR